MSIIGELFFDIPNDDWVRDAICTTTDPEIFHPEKGNQNHEARRICLACPVGKALGHSGGCRCCVCRRTS